MRNLSPMAKPPRVSWLRKLASSIGIQGARIAGPTSDRQVNYEEFDMINLYFWPTPNGLKITVALEELGLPYNVIPINIGKGDQFKPEYLRISPNNKMPAIVDADGPGGNPISIFESGAILIYLAEKT